MGWQCRAMTDSTLQSTKATAWCQAKRFQLPPSASVPASASAARPPVGQGCRPGGQKQEPRRRTRSSALCWTLAHSWIGYQPRCCRRIRTRDHVPAPPPLPVDQRQLRYVRPTKTVRCAARQAAGDLCHGRVASSVMAVPARRPTGAAAAAPRRAAARRLWRRSPGGHSGIRPARA